MRLHTGIVQWFTDSLLGRIALDFLRVLDRMNMFGWCIFSGVMLYASWGGLHYLAYLVEEAQESMRGKGARRKPPES